ncbi:MAG TPA: cysteine rich repeat-containing protein [Candidatus Dormibacteraeota bacterium]|nr:cysteine rich repeat-containing protein [Candidatus Dormibacteraeota bacterium]
MSKCAMALAVTLSLACVIPALAAQSKSPCAAEIEQFCKDVPIGEGRILDCLIQHSDQLSDECRAHVNTAKLFRACLDDVVRLCPGTEPVPGRGVMCLRTHISDLSTACKDELRRVGK